MTEGSGLHTNTITMKAKGDLFGFGADLTGSRAGATMHADFVEE